MGLKLNRLFFKIISGTSLALYRRLVTTTFRQYTIFVSTLLPDEVSYERPEFASWMSMNLVLVAEYRLSFFRWTFVVKCQIASNFSICFPIGVLVLTLHVCLHQRKIDQMAFHMKGLVRQCPLYVFFLQCYGSLGYDHWYQNLLYYCLRQ